jgi:hypothetical protein
MAASGSIMPYGAAIHDAIKRGDRTLMQSLLNDAKALHEKQGDLGQAIQELERAISSKKPS